MRRVAHIYIIYPTGVQEGDIINIIKATLQQHRINDVNYRATDRPNNVMLDVEFTYHSINYDQLSEIREQLVNNLQAYNISEIKQSAAHFIMIKARYTVPIAGFFVSLIIIAGVDFERLYDIRLFDLIKLFIAPVGTLILEIRGDWITRLLNYLWQNNDVNYLIFTNRASISCEVAKCKRTRDGLRHKHIGSDVIPIQNNNTQNS